MLMKKTLLLFSMLVTSIVCIYTSHEKSNSTKGMTMLQTANIEALANNESISNTGPAEEKKCYGGGHKMVCRCINSNPCTGTNCY